MIKNLVYELSGSSEPAIVCLHGWGMSKECFDGLVQNIDSAQKILRLDFFGFGNSDMPDEYFDTYEYAYSIFLLIKKLKLNKVILIGHSFGGRVSIILSSIFNIDVSVLVLTSSAGLNRFSLIRNIRIAKYKILKKLVGLKLCKSAILSKYGSSDYKKLNNGLKKNFIKIVNQDLSHLLKKINSKTYLVWDKKDDSTPYWICRKLNKYIINSQKILYKTGGHFCFIANNYKFSMLINCLINQDLL